MGETAITWFEDPPYEFLSNFHPAAVRLDGVEHRSVEHAYQAAKTLDLLEREHVRSAPTPAVAKELGRQVTIRPGWDELKVAVMRDLLAQKFSDPVLRKRLAATAPLDLIEETPGGTGSGASTTERARTGSAGCSWRSATPSNRRPIGSAHNHRQAPGTNTTR